MIWILNTSRKESSVILLVIEVNPGLKLENGVCSAMQNAYRNTSLCFGSTQLFIIQI